MKAINPKSVLSEGKYTRGTLLSEVHKMLWYDIHCKLRGQNNGLFHNHKIHNCTIEEC